MRSQALSFLRLAIQIACVVIAMVASVRADSVEQFTEEEKAWLATKPTLRAGVDPAWPPFSHIDRKGNIVGIDPDILDLIREQTGIQFQLVTGSSWAEVEQLAREGKVDLLCATAHTQSREQFAKFTQSYLPGVVAIITRDDGAFLTTLVHLEGCKVATPRDYVATKALALDFPRIELVLTDTLAEALQKVSDGDAEAAVCNLMSANHAILTNKLHDLKIAGVTEYAFDMRYAVVADGPAHSVLGKSLAALQRRKIPEVVDRWTGLEFHRSLISNSVKMTLLWAVGIAGGILVLFLVWNRLLAGEIELRRAVEHELLTANEALKVAGEEKNALMQMLAHDLNGPLAVLAMLAGNFKMRAAADPKAANETRMMQEAVEKMARLIRNLLSADVVESGKQKLLIRDLDPARTVRAVLERLQPTATAKQIEVSFAEQQSCTVRADELALDQIIENLVSNAIKFTPLGGRVEVSVLRGAGVAEIRVADTGPGISETEQSQLFRKFSRLSPQPTGGESSHGLGLMLVKRLAEAMEGAVRYERRERGGSVFIVTLRA